MRRPKRTRIPLIGQGAIGRSEAVNSEHLINLYPKMDQTGKAIMSLHNCPGLNLRRGLDSVAGRGLLVIDPFLYVVTGNKLYELDTAFDETLRGSIVSTSGFVSMATNGLVILIVDGDRGYTYTLATETLAEINDADFPTRPDVCTILDGTFVVIQRNTQRFYVSTDGTSWAALDFASAEVVPDDLVSVIVDHQELVLFGEDSTEIWYNSGESFTFSRRTAIENGCAAKGSPAKIDNAVIWLDSNCIVRALRGYVDNRISTHAIEYRIRQHTKQEITAATAFTYSNEGHSFYQITVGDETFVYDFASQKWHQRGWLNPATGLIERHRAECHALYRARNIVLDYEDGRVYEYDYDTFDDDGDEIQAVATFRHLDSSGLRVFIDHLEVEIESGVGTQEGQGQDPLIEMHYSDDGGREFEPWRPAEMGMVGHYRKRAIWGRIGTSNDSVIQVRISDPVKRAIINANLDVTVGS